MPSRRLLPDLGNAGLLMEVQRPAEPDSHNMEAPTLHVVSAQDLDERGKPFVWTPPGGQEAHFATDILRRSGKLVS